MIVIRKGQMIVELKGQMIVELKGQMKKDHWSSPH